MLVPGGVWQPAAWGATKTELTIGNFLGVMRPRHIPRIHDHCHENSETYSDHFVILQNLKSCCKSNYRLEFKIKSFFRKKLIILIQIG